MQIKFAPLPVPASRCVYGYASIKKHFPSVLTEIQASLDIVQNSEFGPDMVDSILSAAYRMTDPQPQGPFAFRMETSIT